MAARISEVVEAIADAIDSEAERVEPRQRSRGGPLTLNPLLDAGVIVKPRGFSVILDDGREFVFSLTVKHP